jgi:hypothetical protein
VFFISGFAAFNVPIDTPVLLLTLARDSPALAKYLVVAAGDWLGFNAEFERIEVGCIVSVSLLSHSWGPL